MALFHYKDGTDPKVLEYNQIVDPNRKRLNMPHGYRFIKIDYGDVGEARRRALVLALLTFNFKTRSFITMYTREMMEEGFFLSSMHRQQEFYQSKVLVGHITAACTPLEATPPVKTRGRASPRQESPEQSPRCNPERLADAEHTGFIVSERCERDIGLLEDSARAQYYITIGLPPKRRITSGSIATSTQTDEFFP